MVIVNAWELNHDPETYGSDSYEFNPGRYLDEKGRLISGPPGTKDDGHFSFGKLSCMFFVSRSFLTACRIR